MLATKSACRGDVEVSKYTLVIVDRTMCIAKLDSQKTSDRAGVRSVRRQLPTVVLAGDDVSWVAFTHASGQ